VTDKLHYSGPRRRPTIRVATVQKTVKLPDPVNDKLRQYCFTQRISQQDAMILAVERYLEKHAVAPTVESQDDSLMIPMFLPRQQEKKWRQALGVLDDRERRIFEARRLAGVQTTLQKLGDEFGITRERVRQIEACAFEKIRNHTDK
jgi:RNA polymerase sigma factor (sigma-70 family)